MLRQAQHARFYVQVCVKVIISLRQFKEEEVL